MSKRWILSIVIAAFVVGCGSGCVNRTKKFETTVKAVVNPDELQAWATNLIVTARSVDHRTDAIVSYSDYPKWVGAIGAIYKDSRGKGEIGQVSIVNLKNGVGNADSVVTIDYIRGDCGLLVGYPTLVLTNQNSYFVRPWKPGIYFYYGQ
jgi:hypothetical protein